MPNLPLAPPLDHSTPGWHPFPYEDSTNAYVHRAIPYTANPNVLQNLTLYVPRAPENRTIPPPPTHWLIYIHGGAWRDPLISASSCDALAAHLFHKISSSVPTVSNTTTATTSTTTTASNNNEGFKTVVASINYSLSPHPSHPLPPSSTPAERASRTATHPQHLHDVCAALRFLQRSYGFGSHYVLCGHSCGATLALQACLSGFNAGLELREGNSERTEMADPKTPKLDSEKSQFHPPAALIGINGLYDLPRLVDSPGSKHTDLREIYREILVGAFGPDDERVWRGASPAYMLGEFGRVASRMKFWRGLKRVVLVSSKEDELVDNEGQVGSLREKMRAVEGEDGGVKVSERRVGGGHDEVWKDGRELAGVLLEVLPDLES